MIETIMKLVRSPNVFVYLILFLYACSAARYIAAHRYGNALYWLCAFGITISATFMMNGGSKP